MTRLPRVLVTYMIAVVACSGMPVEQAKPDRLAPHAGASGRAHTASAGQRAPNMPATPISKACELALPRVQRVDPERAERGGSLLETPVLTPGIMPEIVLRNLWVAWGTPSTRAD